MLQFERSSKRWWQKPLVIVDGKHIPAELAVLFANLEAQEMGAWLNSRGTKSATVGFAGSRSGEFKTLRAPLPDFVAVQLQGLYRESTLGKGAPDLVVWREADRSVRFIEVKNPHWDCPSPEQIQFLAAAQARGISTAIVEWEFRS